MGRTRSGQGTRDGFSRRALLQASGGGVAAAAIVGLGVRPASASDEPEQPATPENLTEVDPHAFTARPDQPSGRPDRPQVRILPIDRAKFLAGARFDLRVEATGVDPETTRIDIQVHGEDGPEPLLIGDPERTSSVEDSLEVTYTELAYANPGHFTIKAIVRARGSGRVEAEVHHEVVTADAGGQRAKNVIFFLGDGMGAAAITAARVLSKGITEGKYHGLLEMDQMEFRGIVGTSGVDALSPDSAHTMAAYMTGHKSSVNAMGVYEGNNPDPNDHPRVETMAEVLKRARGMSIGVVTTAEIQDATPAAVWAHTRQRREYIEIMDQALEPEQTPDVLMGGGLASLLPQSEEESRREDDRDLVKEFADLGFAYAQTREQLNAVMAGEIPERLLGLFHTGNLNVYLDRQHDKQDDVLGEWNDQPNLMEMTTAALRILERNENGFFLMVEGASIDKMEHPMDGPRVVYDTIEFDQAIGVAKQWAQDRDDTLIVVTADHNHSMSIVGTHDRRGSDEGRAANGVYGGATYPTYVDDDGDGFPDDPDPDVQLFFGWSSHPDHTDDFQHNSVFSQPALLDDDGRAVDNPDRDPDAELQIGNLPFNQTNCVHTVDDVSIVASGPGAARVNAYLDNTEVFFVLMDALGLDPRTDVAAE
ncbi:alkaline phosphatase [Phytoactinopolyspora mesophila]|uniref:Alkaline phosphatase n=1 Tax=Phytoactinopolyspora mesophila TaxID=2650750 RepID=A0A7K3M339_9ACTN|nr:alkaline phosphatase [Phytoactinopolyspora mesophila]NDL57733.1 alkaline phosphatase [Phytoactinopolyspora mesophila]